MSSNFSNKLKTALAVHKQKVIQNKNHMIALLSEWLKRKLEEIISEDIRHRIMHGGLLLREAFSPDKTSPIDQVLSTASRHRWSNTFFR